jgi:hypothetical protein
VEGHEGYELWYLIHQGRVAAAIPPPQDAAARQQAGAHIEAVYSPQRRRTEPASIDELDGVLLVVSWFRKYPDEHARLLDPAAALNLCRGVS